MMTFDGWRAVGRAMRWARQQDGVTVTHDGDAWFGHEWDRNSMDVVRLGGRGNRQGYGVMVSLADGRHVESAGLDAATALRVLAALDLIPAELADPRPAVTVDHRVIMAFINAPDEPDGDIGGPLRVAFRAAGVEVAE